MATIESVESWEYFLEVLYVSGQVIRIAAPSEQRATYLLGLFKEGITREQRYADIDGLAFVTFDQIQVVHVGRKDYTPLVGIHAQLA